MHLTDETDLLTHGATEFVAHDLADAFSDYMAADPAAHREHRNSAGVVGMWLSDQDLAGRWDMIDFAALATRIRGSRREQGLFWITVTGILVFMSQARLLPKPRVRAYLETIVEVAPDDPAMLSLLCAGQAVLEDMVLN